MHMHMHMRWWWWVDVGREMTHAGARHRHTHDTQDTHTTHKTQKTQTHKAQTHKAQTLTRHRHSQDTDTQDTDTHKTQTLTRHRHSQDADTQDTDTHKTQTLTGRRRLGREAERRRRSLGSDTTAARYGWMQARRRDSPTRHTSKTHGQDTQAGQLAGWAATLEAPRRAQRSARRPRPPPPTICVFLA